MKSILSRLLSRTPPSGGAVPRPRSFFDGARTDRLSSPYPDQQEINFALSQSGDLLIKRAREYCRNNAYFAKALEMFKNNIVGERFSFQSKSERNADAIERRWKKWSESVSCDYLGRNDLWQIVRQVVTHLKRDGEAFVHLEQVGGELKLKIIDPLRVPFDASRANSSYSPVVGDAVINGVEVDAQYRPIAYHVQNVPPSQLNPTEAYQYHTRRISARNILHVYSPESSHQQRGYTAFAPVMQAASLLARYEKAAVVRATASSEVMAFMKRMDYAQPEAGADVSDEEVAANHGILRETSPGIIEVLPDGYDLVQYDPKSPDAVFVPFVDKSLQKIAAGLNLNYHTLANDFKTINFSTARFAYGESRETFKATQRQIVTQLLTPLFERWLAIEKLNALRNIVADPLASEHVFRGRAWEYIDPKKDAETAQLLLENGLTTKTIICENRGLNFEDVVLQRAREIEFENETLGTDDQETENDRAISLSNVV